VNPARRTTRLLQRRFALAGGILLALALTVTLAVGRAEEPTGPLTVPVTAMAAPSQPAMTGVADRAMQPTLPGGKLPQYQLTARHRRVETDDEIADPTIRFFLVLPSEPILVEATITIDGEPFRKQRERRIQTALTAALEPAPESESAETAETGDSALAADAVADGAPEPDPESPDDGEVPDPELAESPAPADSAPPSHVETLRRYIASIGREPSPEEVRWFFINRLDGPTLLVLKESFHAFRADQSPVFRILDRNRDGILSRAEIELAAESFLECDLNRDEVVEFGEISEVANDPRRQHDSRIETGPLLILLPVAERADETYSQLRSVGAGSADRDSPLSAKFDPNADGRWDSSELDRLRRMRPDLALSINFSLSAPAESSLSISEESRAALAKQGTSAEAVNGSIVLSREDCEIWISANQSRPGDQISLGAVRDGYPMLPVLDPDNDGRFTLRELRGLVDAVKQFDRNGDGQITQDELRPTIRVGFGLGAGVHRELSEVRRVHPPRAAQVAGPEWFVRMDRNKDNDLTRKEFPGTDEQFDRLDADGDGLVSAEEAWEFERKSPTNRSSEEPSGESSPPSAENKPESDTGDGDR
jgi:Ca2+-binding EF-hand superfamily protein